MKKYFSMMAIALMAFAIGCSSSDDDPTPTPDTPTVLATPAPAVDQSSVTETGFTVSWPAVANAASYKYTLNDGAEQSVSGTTFTASGLTAGTSYTVKVKAVSGDATKYTDSEWGSCTATTASESGDGSTLATPAPAVDPSSVTETGFTVTWPAIANAASYKYTLNDGAEQSAAVNNVTLSGLTAGTSYTVKVKAISGDTSKWADSEWGSCTATTASASTGDNGHPSLNGSEYYLISLDATTYEKIKTKVVADFRVNDVTSFLYWWNGAAFTSGDSVGPNFYGEIEGWCSLNVVPDSGWFGAGFFCNDTEALHYLLNINETNGEGYYLHMAWMGNSTGNFGVHLYDNTIEPEVIIGDASSEYGFARDSEWHEIEIPMTYFYEKGLYYREPFVGSDGAPGLNVMAITQPSDGTWPKEINLDACFIYKK